MNQVKPERMQFPRGQKGFKGWKLQVASMEKNGLPGALVTRGHNRKFGNPFNDGTRAEVVAKFRQWLHSTPEGAAMIADAKKRLPGKNLFCSCSLDGAPCHADVLLEITNADE
jgi:hypothetical protein